MTPAPKPTALPSAFEPDEHDALLQSYAEIGKRYAPLFAAHGPGNLTERKVKALIMSIQVSIRASKHAAGEKITDGAVEALAYADSRVGDRLHEVEMGRLAFQQAEIDLECCRERLRRLDAVTRRGI